MKRKTIVSMISAAIVAASFCISSAASAAVPQALTHQGRLYDADGQPISSVVTMAFRIYDDAGTELWTESHSVTFEDGYYSIELGSKTPFPKDLWAAASLEMGITVGADPEMAPRAAIRSVPYALVAGDAVGDIHPTSVTVGDKPVIDATGMWVGDPTGLIGPTGPAGADGAVGPIGPTGAAGPMGPAGPTGAAGAQGAMGPQGMMGVQGPTGPTGPAGAQGIQGPTGPTGAAGPQGLQGLQGAPGATGASGTVTTLSFDNPDIGPTITAGTPFVPTPCRTGAYTPATAGQVAIMQTSVSAAVTAPGTGAVLLMAPAFSTNNFTTFNFAVGSYALDQIDPGAGSTSSVARIPLTQGVTYNFGVVVNSDANVSLLASSCLGVVTIVRN